MVASVDKVFSESIRHLPMVKGHQDTSRSATELLGVLRTGPGLDGDVSGGNVQSWQSSIAGGKTQLHVDRRKYPGLVVRTGDKFVALERPGQPVFEIASFEDRGDTRLVAYVDQR